MCSNGYKHTRRGVPRRPIARSDDHRADHDGGGDAPPRSTRTPRRLSEDAREQASHRPPSSSRAGDPSVHRAPSRGMVTCGPPRPRRVEPAVGDDDSDVVGRRRTPCGAGGGAPDADGSDQGARGGASWRTAPRDEGPAAGACSAPRVARRTRREGDDGEDDAGIRGGFEEDPVADSARASEGARGARGGPRSADAVVDLDDQAAQPGRWVGGGRVLVVAAHAGVQRRAGSRSRSPRRGPVVPCGAVPDHEQQHARRARTAPLRGWRCRTAARAGG